MSQGTRFVAWHEKKAYARSRAQRKKLNHEFENGSVCFFFTLFFFLFLIFYIHLVYVHIFKLEFCNLYFVHLRYYYFFVKSYLLPNWFSKKIVDCYYWRNGLTSSAACSDDDAHGTAKQRIMKTTGGNANVDNLPAVRNIAREKNDKAKRGRTKEGEREKSVSVSSMELARACTVFSSFICVHACSCVCVCVWVF